MGSKFKYDNYKLRYHIFRNYNKESEFEEKNEDYMDGSKNDKNTIYVHNFDKSIKCNID